MNSCVPAPLRARFSAQISTMRWTAIALTLLASAGCISFVDSRTSSKADAGAPIADAGAPTADAGAAVADAGTASGDAGIATFDAGTAADGGALECDFVSVLADGGTEPSDAGPPDAGFTWSPGQTPASAQQVASWLPTGAAGCEGLVPATVPPRLSWSGPRQFCFASQPLVDGLGDVSFAFDGSLNSGPILSAFFLSDGSAGQLVANLPLLGSRPKGFFATLTSQTGQWDFAVAPDGSDQGLVRSDSDPNCTTFIYSNYDLTPDPRGGYVETRVRAELLNAAPWEIWKSELRWADANLVPRTQWLVGTTWNYDFNIESKVYVDLTGNALVMLFFDPPMSMPCAGTMTAAFWAADSGAVSPFTPVTPTVQTDQCDSPQFAGFGSGVVLGDGGVAFYEPPLQWTNYVPSASGWYVRYPSGSGVGSAVPSWLNAYDGTLERRADGRAWSRLIRDPSDCTRTAQIVGPAGQLCATLVVAGSEGCSANDEISADGTLTLQDQTACTLRWWPGLVRAR